MFIGAQVIERWIKIWTKGYMCLRCFLFGYVKDVLFVKKSCKPVDIYERTWHKFLINYMLQKLHMFTCVHKL